MSRFVIVFFALVVFAIGSCKDLPKKCKTNSDCAKGEVCEKTWHEGSGCTSTTSCNDDGSSCYTTQNCDSSGWRYYCTAMACSASDACGPTGTACREGFCAEVACQDWTQCANGEACKANLCTASECSVSCAQPRACRQGICQVVACTDVSGCNTGEQCRDGNCMQ